MRAVKNRNLPPNDATFEILRRGRLLPVPLAWNDLEKPRMERAKRSSHRRKLWKADARRMVLRKGCAQMGKRRMEAVELESALIDKCVRQYAVMVGPLVSPTGDKAWDRGTFLSLLLLRLVRENERFESELLVSPKP